MYRSEGGVKTNQDEQHLAVEYQQMVGIGASVYLSSYKCVGWSFSFVQALLIEINAKMGNYCKILWTPYIVKLIKGC